MPSTSSIDARSFGPTPIGHARAIPDAKNPRLSRRPQVALVRSLADTGRDGAGQVSHRSFKDRTPSRLRQMLEICLIVVFCLCAGFALWQRQDNPGCSPKLYRDPVTGRVASYGTPHESLKTQARCARLDFPGRNPVAMRVE